MRVVVGNRRRGGGWWRLGLVVIGWLMIAAPTIVAALVVTRVRAVARALPPPPDLAAWQATAPRTSTLVARDGTTLTTLPFLDGAVVGNRQVVPLAALPPVLIDAVLAAEDVRFYAHRGVDYAAVARAAWVNWRAARTVEGASTITQQLARNLSPEIGKARSFERKVREALVARQLERRYAKAAILEAYLNFVFVGRGAYGMAAGAEAYFGRPPATLALEEATYGILWTESERREVERSFESWRKLGTPTAVVTDFYFPVYLQTAIRFQPLVLAERKLYERTLRLETPRGRTERICHDFIF